MGWSLGLLVLTENSVIVVATACIADFPQSWAFIRQMGVATFGTLRKGAQALVWVDDVLR